MANVNWEEPTCLGAVQGQEWTADQEFGSALTASLHMSDNPEDDHDASYATDSVLHSYSDDSSGGNHTHRNTSQAGGQQGLEQNNGAARRTSRRQTAAIPVAATDGEGGGTRGANGGIRPWVLILIISLVQMLLSSSTLPSSGVNASSAEQLVDSRSGHSTENTDGGRHHGGNGAVAGEGGTGRGYNQQYFRQLPPINDTRKAAGYIVTERMTESRRLLLRQEAKDMFLHGYHGYLNYAFPKDELNPVACNGRGPDKENVNNININDVLGDFSLTLIDVLDTLAAMREPKLFQQAIHMVKKYVGNFDINSRVQVFEVNIRVLGALLSGHLYASDPSYKSLVKDYKGELLSMAEDLGKRLIKAFENAPIGIPWPRVNLKRGVLRDESIENCVAGAGSLLLEFGVLSRLTGDRRYEDAAKRALMELWNRRSKIGLMGNTINISTGNWMSYMTGIGAGTDSFYEYLIKSYILFGDEKYLEMYETAQEAIRRNLLHDSKYFYKHVNLQDGSLMAHWVDSLSAFMPGVQVLGGDLESAIKNHLYYYNIWRRYQAIPERFDFVKQTVAIANYPLRPEFIESNYFLYRATKDPFYLEVGEMILRDLQAYTKTKCGWSSLRSVVDKKHEDRMESFALSETFKYLYLLFDEENLLHQELKDTNFVFTTEGHVLSLSSKYLDRREHNSSDREPSRHQYSKQSLSAAIQGAYHHHGESVKTGGPICKAYRAPDTFLKSIRYRPDADFARQMVGAREDFRDQLELDPKGYCEKPTLDVERVIVEFVGPPTKTVFDEDEDEEVVMDGESAANVDEKAKQEEYSRKKLAEQAKELMVIPIKKGVFVNKIVGVKMQIQYDGVQNGYRAVKVADYPLSLNCNVYIEQSSMQPLWDSYQRSQDAHLRVFRTSGALTVQGDALFNDLLVTPAEFGYWRPRVVDFNQPLFPTSTRESSQADHLENTISQQWQQPLMAPATAASGTLKRIRARKLVRIEQNVNGCRPFNSTQAHRVQDKILVVDRGGCLFILKAYYAQAAGAHSLVVINTEETTFAMTGVDSNAAAATAAVSSPSQPGEPGGHGNSGETVGESIQDDEIDIHAVMISHSLGQQLLDWMREDAAPKRSSSGSSSSFGSESVEESSLVAGFVQRKVAKEEMANARLSYNSLPIVNVFSINVPKNTM
ncbi:alpha mannosidase-like protein [Mortierella claussenii]|nr:alpha mannosidase-like protein [Mortierella claussenii]